MKSPSVTIHLKAGIAAAVVGFCLSGPAAAQDASVAPGRLLGSSAYAAGTLSVASDAGYSVTISSRAGVPALAALGKLPDGGYTFQVSAATGRADRSAADANNGRDASAPKPRQSVSASGTFRVVNGKIVLPAASRSANGDRD